MNWQKFFFLVATTCWAVFPLQSAAKCSLVLEKLLSSTSIQAQAREPLPSTSAFFESIFAIREQDQGRILGYASPVKVASSNKLILAVSIHEREGLPRPGDCLEFVDLSQKNAALPVRYDLMRRNLKNISSRYQPLVYQGYWFRETAAPLGHQEWIAGLGIIGYGVLPNLSLSTAPIWNAVGVINAAGKYLLWEDSDIRVAALSSLEWDARFDLLRGHASLLGDVFANSRFATHYRLSLLSPREKVRNLEAELTEWTVRFDTSLAILFFDWNRLIIGPQFDFRNRVLGGQIAMAFVYDRFTWMIGVSTQDFSQTSARRGSLSYGVDLWWRF